MKERLLRGQSENTSLGWKGLYFLTRVRHLAAGIEDYNW